MEQNRNVQYLVTFAVCVLLIMYTSVALAGMTASVAYSWTTPVIPKFHNNETELTLTDTEISWMVSVISPGAVIGYFVSRAASDRFGRRTTLLGSALPLTIGTIFAVVTTKVWQLLLARFCWGFGIGTMLPVAMIYVTEIASKEIRGKLASINRYIYIFGSFLVITVGSVATYQQLGYMLFALTICYFGVCLWVPETPYYLLKEGKIAAAKKSLKKLNGYKDNTVLEEKLKNMHSQVKDEMKRSGTHKELFTGKQYRRAIFICVGLRLTQGMTGSICLEQYLGRILQETNSTFSISIGMITYGAMKCTMCIVSSFLVDKLGRRPLLIYSYLGASLTLASLGALFFGHEVLNQTPNYFGYIILFNFILFTTVSNLGFETVNFVIQTEIFPLNVRSTAMTYSMLLASITGFVTMRGYQIIKYFSGMYGIFWLYAGFALLGTIFSYVAVPETKGKSLREIQKELQGELYEEANEELTKNKKHADIQELKRIDKSDETLRLKV